MARGWAASRREFLKAAGLLVAGGAVAGTGVAEAEGAGADAVVTTPLGALRGEVVGGVRVFRGVPFAQPPLGPLRFRPPAKVTPWTGVRDAKEFAAAAMQPKEAGVAVSEDCLYLNIWAPVEGGPFPVFVWIHGGGYTGGRASAPIFDGTQFAREGIVLVTVAYRLGVFGFMDLEPLLGPEFADSGNNALRDLVCSLRWVQGNIAAFGGDPARVTVGGESAGAKASAALMAIAEANELFGSVVSESGGGERVQYVEEAAEVAHAFAAGWRRGHAHAPAGAAAPSADRFDDLLTAPPGALIEAQGRFVASWPHDFPFRPVAGGSYLSKRPVELVARGSAKGKRLLIGTNRDESALFLGPHPMSDPTQRLLGNLTVERFNAVFAKYAALYPEMSASGRRIRAVTAEEYWVPSIRLADAHTAAGGRTWMYRLDYAKSKGEMAGEAYHSLDLGLVWQKLDKEEQGEADALVLSQQMHQAWSAFIRGGPPAAKGLAEWPEYTPGTRATMILSGASHVEQRPFEDELRLWNGVM